MYKRLIIMSVIIVAALSGLVWMGYHSIRIRAQGMEGARLGEFAAVAEQVRQDVKRKLDTFMQTEQNRPYTDYQYYYVPEDVGPSRQRQMPVLRSPLGGRLEHGLAYGNFQLEPDGSITTPNDGSEQRQDAGSAGDELRAKVLLNRRNIERNLLPVLNRTAPGSLKTNLYGAAVYSPMASPEKAEQAGPVGDAPAVTGGLKSKSPRARQAENYPIESLQSQGQKTQVIEQRRSVVEQNIASNAAVESQQAVEERGGRQAAQVQPPPTVPMQQAADVYDSQLSPAEESQVETVQVRIEPFVPLLVPCEQDQQSIFGGQVFLLRHVQIEDRHFLQGFQLNEKELVEEVKESAMRFMREGMNFELSHTGGERSKGDVAHAAILDFGFGDLTLNLKEVDPDWIGQEIRHLRWWYFSIVAVVLLAVMLGLVSLWSNAEAQMKLARKKDDFISAVSHELRTPLTSIRMYAEMLEKNWVKSQDKAAEYYRNMRQESERLSRLIENVLDFSRIQRGRKRYVFTVGDINNCVGAVVEMMKPYATQRGFSVTTELGQIEPLAFDSDAVTQIVVNLLDNAIKYALPPRLLAQTAAGEDRTITVRTKNQTGFTGLSCHPVQRGSDSRFVLIEVEDRGPGVPHRQREKIFESFYRSEAPVSSGEDRNGGGQTAGIGLGLALVKKFAEAHNGFVEVVGARPTGAIFRVALAAQLDTR